MIRDSPPELARAFAGPYSSSSRTLRRQRRSQWALHAPKAPAPITATSYVGMATFVAQFGVGGSPFGCGNCRCGSRVQTSIFILASHPERSEGSRKDL